MMNRVFGRMRLTGVAALVVLLAIVGGAVGAQDADVAYVRFAHNAAGVGAVDGYVDGQVTTLVPVEFGSVSEWIEVPAGAQRVSVGAAGGDPTFNLTTNLQAGTWSTITAALGTSGRPTLSRTEEVARVRVMHLAQGAPRVDVLVDDSVAIPDFAFGEVSDWVALPAGSYKLAIAPSGSTTPIRTVFANLTPGVDYYVAALGDGDDGVSTLRVVRDENPLPNPEAARIVLFNGVPDSVIGLGLTDGRVILAGVGFPGVLGDNDGLAEVEVPSGLYSFRLFLESGGVLTDVRQIGVDNGETVVIIAYGNEGSGRALVR